MRIPTSPGDLLRACRWKSREWYGRLRCWLAGGEFVFTSPSGIRFVASADQPFSFVHYVWEGYEAREMDWCRRWLVNGDSVVDCGANIGYFSAWLAQRCMLTQIIAVEGNALSATRCARNATLLGLASVKMVRAVLSGDPRQRLLIPDRPGREPWQRAVATTAATSIPTFTLDQLIATHQVQPALVKIDCEGCETSILRGAGRLLQQVRPAWMVECNDEALRSAGSDRTTLFGMFRRAHYRLFHLSSFDGSHPLGTAVDDNFPSGNFNFAAIHEDAGNLNRWQHSIEGL